MIKNLWKSPWEEVKSLNVLQAPEHIKVQQKLWLEVKMQLFTWKTKIITIQSWDDVQLADFPVSASSWKANFEVFF